MEEQTVRANLLFHTFWHALIEGIITHHCGGEIITLFQLLLNNAHSINFLDGKFDFT
jgi:hypothetical protein